MLKISKMAGPQFENPTSKMRSSLERSVYSEGNIWPHVAVLPLMWSATDSRLRRSASPDGPSELLREEESALISEHGAAYNTSPGRKELGERERGGRERGEHCTALMNYPESD